MAQYHVPDPEELIECPYDRVHMVRAKRFQYHLVRCRKNYIGSEFQKCPFNAKHHVPKPEFRHHIANCPDKAIVETEIGAANKREENQLKGCTDTPAYKNLEIPNQEDWDEEISAPVRRGPAYDEMYYERVKFKDITGMTKAQKTVLHDNRLTSEQKRAEMNLYAQTSSLDKQGNSSLRLPRTAPMVAMATEPKAVPPVQPAYAYALAQGRGRGIQTMNGVTPNGTVNIKKLLYVFFPSTPFIWNMNLFKLLISLLHMI
ncbi:GTSF1-like protein [Mya arenaria]|uniref:GTSF1-like protein n=1 Tax=Mya arenaria TaxID=6604 RepID=A0ABY7F695_MYAAR|nr:GTSF1-like protein [Mya arenaria]